MKVEKIQTVNGRTYELVDGDCDTCDANNSDCVYMDCISGFKYKRYKESAYLPITYAEGVPGVTFPDGRFVKIDDELVEMIKTR